MNQTGRKQDLNIPVQVHRCDEEDKTFIQRKLKNVDQHEDEQIHDPVSAVFLI